MKKTNIILGICITAGLLLSVLGFTYAFFRNRIENPIGSTISTDIINLSMTFADGQTITLSDIYPGTTASKTFTVQNTGDATIYYDILMDNVVSSVTGDDLIFSLTSTNSGATVTNRVMPNNDSAVATKVAINSGVTQTYTMTINYQNLDQNQNYNQGTSYTGNLKIISPYETTSSGTANITLVDRIKYDNTAYPDNAASKYVTPSTGINFAKVSGYEYSSYATIIKTVSFTSNANKYIGTGFTYDNGTFRPTTGGTYDNTYSQSSIGKYTCNTNETWCRFGSPMYKILEVSGSTVTKVEAYYPYKNKTAINGLGLYSTSTNTKNSALTYYFRGDVLNNYVQFAGTLWRIVRITEDGTIKMIKETASANSQFNTTYTDKMYVGYMYGTSASPYTNTNNSTIKTKLESIASINLTSYASYLSNTETCNDRQEYSVSGSNVYYGARQRLVDNKTPKYACTQSTDLFTANAGLISADEIAYAGGVYGKVSDMYLNNNTYWWSASPYYFYSTYAYVFRGNPGGSLDNSNVSGTIGVRPVVSLNSNTLTLGGSGTEDSPYIVTTGGSWTNS